MKSRAPQLHLEYRFYKVLGNAGKITFSSSRIRLKKISVLSREFDFGVQEVPNI